MPKPLAYDRWLLFTPAVLVLAGLFMVGSASHYVALSAEDTPSYLFLAKQTGHVLVGLALGRMLFRIDYRRFSQPWVIHLLMVFCVVALILVLLMPPIGGARRWLVIGPFRAQPSEFAKLAVVVFLAYGLARRRERNEEPGTVGVPTLAVIGLLAFLIYLEPDLGSAAVLLGLSGLMLFAAGLRWRYIAAGGVAGALLVGLAVSGSDYRNRRIRAFLEPAADRQGDSWQLDQSLVAIGSGGLTGVGPGQGRQEAFFLPEPHTDFVFSVVGEEFGLLGASALLVGFLVLFWRGVRAAARAPDRFGWLLALGTTCLLVLPALINMAVCLGLVPTKGLALPFISYGGSSLVVSMAASGLLLNVSQYSN